MQSPPFPRYLVPPSYLRVYGKIILKWALSKEKGWTWIGFVWLRTETCKALLWTRLWTCGFHKILEISSVAEPQWPYQKKTLLQELNLSSAECACSVCRTQPFQAIVASHQQNSNALSRHSVPLLHALPQWFISLRRYLQFDRLTSRHCVPPWVTALHGYECWYSISAWRTNQVAWESVDSKI